ncbi:single-stranded-DNA-specific exonuclease RecJ [bacterium]|nr:single-stranded-DNA-specific exonuclease RecJ [bacterium]
MSPRYRWVLQPRLSKDLKIQLLYNRGLISSLNPSAEELEAFFHPNPKKHLYDPFLLKDLEKAVKRILQASKEKEKVGIFADYDADGIPGGAFLYEALKKLGLEPVVYIPSRSEGYGFSPSAVQYFARKKCSLVITVDAGIRDFKAVKEANRRGIEVIICDHHEPAKRVPSAFAVIDPKRKDEKYPFRELSGAGVAFKLVQGISRLDSRIDNEFLRWSLDLMAISVIFDMVPLVSENRLLAKLGLLVLRNTRRVGLRKLIEVASLKPETISAYEVGFMLAPRLNAPGRIYDPKTSFQLLITKDEEEAQELAEILDAVNRERQRQTEKFLQEALKQIEKEKLHRHKIILVQGEEWPSGLVGLIASKLKEMFSRPVFVFQRGKKTSRGSARSIDGFHLVEALSFAQDLLVKGGGHAKAAGVEVENEKIKQFYERLLKLAEKKLSEKDLVPKLEIDASLSFKEITWDLWELVESMEPYGMGNPRPLFLTSGAKVLEVRALGKEGKHTEMLLEEGGQIMRAVCFNGGEIAQKLGRGEEIDLVYSLNLNDFDGRPKVELKVEDLKSSES